MWTSLFSLIRYQRASYPFPANRENTPIRSKRNASIDSLPLPTSAGSRSQPVPLATHWNAQPGKLEGTWISKTSCILPSQPCKDGHNPVSCDTIKFIKQWSSLINLRSFNSSPSLNYNIHFNLSKLVPNQLRPTDFDWSSAQERGARSALLPIEHKRPQSQQLPP